MRGVGASEAIRTLEPMKPPAEIERDVKRERVREAVEAEGVEVSTVPPGRIARRVPLSREEVVEFLGELADAMDEQIAA